MTIFVNTILVIAFIIATLLINTVITYKDYKENRWLNNNYSDYSIFVEAFKHELVRTEFYASILIPIAILIDFFMLYN